MKMSLIAAATLATITLGAAGSANAGVAGATLNGIGIHAEKSVVEHVDYRKKRYYKRDYRRGYKRHYRGNNQKWVCRYRFGRRHCAWR
ncbi:hypothetical protein [Hyphomicrobium sp.]|uniref:hypothetical protein n=1 Tax=Hyphomicrobium sp. TaxID=82 RepID=UPI001D654BD9|nr:hypothetical protein [Hyphomicrobium sp.]MBY0562167.1 hypothetical protein [Hyphomicrobium sp.]